MKEILLGRKASMALSNFFNSIWPECKHGMPVNLWHGIVKIYVLLHDLFAAVILWFFFWMCIHVYGQVCTLDLCVSACMRQGMREWRRDHCFLFVRHITSDLFTHVCMMRCGGVGRWKWWKGRVQVHCYAEGRKIVKHIYLTHRQWNLPRILYC